MRKNNPRSVAAAVASAPVTGGNRLAEIEARRAELEKQMEQLRNLETERINQVHTEIESLANEMREHFKSLGIRESAINVFNRALKGVLRNTSTAQQANVLGRKPRVSLSDEQKKDIVRELRGNVPASALASKYNVSLGTIANIKREAGMVRHRVAA